MSTNTHAPPRRDAYESSWQNYLRELWGRRHFATHLSLAGIESRNASTVLGLFWWVLSPLFLGGIYYFVIGIVFRARATDPNYLFFLLAGLFAFYYTRGAMTSSSNSVISSAKLMTNIRFPRLILPAAGTLEAAFGFLVSIAVFLAFGLMLGLQLTPRLAAFPLIFIVHTIFNFGLGTITARLTVPFRDVRNLLPYILRVWLYLSPVLFTLDRVPGWARSAMSLNPLTSYLTLYRWALIAEPTTVGVDEWIPALAFATGICAVGVILFVRGERTFVRYL